MLHIHKINYCKFHRSESKGIIILVPLIFENKGERPIIVEDLQLRFMHEKYNSCHLRFTAIRKSLEANLGFTLDRQFIIKPHEAIKKNYLSD